MESGPRLLISVNLISAHIEVVRLMRKTKYYPKAGSDLI